MERKIHLYTKAEKALAKINNPMRKRIIDEISDLAKIPPMGDIKPLNGIKGSFRARVGKYRIIFEIDEDTVRISNVESRGGVYKGGL